MRLWGAERHPQSVAPSTRKSNPKTFQLLILERKTLTSRMRHLPRSLLNTHGPHFAQVGFARVISPKSFRPSHFAHVLSTKLFRPSRFASRNWSHEMSETRPDKVRGSNTRSRQLRVINAFRRNTGRECSVAGGGRARWRQCCWHCRHLDGTAGPACQLQDSPHVWGYNPA